MKIIELGGVRPSKVAILIYGANGTGKTHFGATFHSPEGKSLILACDPNYEAVPVRKNVVPIQDWATFKQAVGTLPLDQFDSVVVDTTSALLELEQAYVCQQHGIKYPDDLARGKGWHACRVELGQVLTKLEAKARNLVYLAQEKSLEIQLTPARRIVKTVSMFSEAAGARIRGVTCLTGRLMVTDGQHTIDFRTSDAQEGKDTGRFVEGGVLQGSGSELWSLLFGAPVGARS